MPNEADFPKKIYLSDKIKWLNHTVDTEFSVTNFFCLHFSEHAQWGLLVMSDILVKIFVDFSCNICGLFLWKLQELEIFN